MAPHSSTLAWKIPWTEEPGRLQSMGSLRVGHDWATSLSHFTFMHCRRKWQPIPVLLPGESQGWGNLVGCHLWGRTESNKTEATYQATAAALRVGALETTQVIHPFYCSSQAEGYKYIQASKAGAQERMQRQVSSKKLARPDKVRLRVEALVGWISRHLQFPWDVLGP